jgi:chromodomain-helicase-DNA-binding protein 7
MPFDLKYHSSPKNLGPAVIPGTSSTLTPIDLSSGLPKVNTPEIPKSKEMINEVQDFSMPSKNKQKSKLDEMLGKLMKKNNCVSNSLHSLFLLLCIIYVRVGSLET